MKLRLQVYDNQGRLRTIATEAFSSRSNIDLEAAVNLSALKVITTNVDGKAIYASSSNLDHFNKIVGINERAAVAGGEATVIFAGYMRDDDWTWDLDKPIFLGIDGALTQTPPSSGFRIIVAFPLSETDIIVDIKECIKLV